jgi:hypothetical protein
MSPASTQRRMDLAEAVTAVVLEARTLVLKGLATREQGVALAIEILACEETEKLRVYVRDQLSVLTDH